MRKLIFGSFILFGLWYLSACHSASNSGTTAENRDTIHKLDSIAQENVFLQERSNFQTTIQEQIDSLDFQLAHNDTIYNGKNGAALAEWQKNRSRINARMANLKRKRNNISSVARKDWGHFKQDIDTTFANLKLDWKRILDDMKVR